MDCNFFLVDGDHLFLPQISEQSGDGDSSGANRLRDRLIELSYIDGTMPGLVPMPDGGASRGAAPGGGQRRAQGNRPGGGSVILDEDDEEQSLGALGKALQEALKEVGDDDLLGADDED